MSAKPPPQTLTLKKGRPPDAGEAKDAAPQPSRKGQAAGPADKPRAR